MDLRVIDAARVVVSLDTTVRQFPGDDRRAGSTRDKKARGRLAGALSVWEALTNLPQGAALEYAYNVVRLADEAAARLAEALDVPEHLLGVRAFNDPTVDCCGRDAADCDCPPENYIDALRDFGGDADMRRMVYRCKYIGMDPAGCDWSTTDYSQIDAHEDQAEPGHYVEGSAEEVPDDVTRVDRYTVTVHGQSVRATDDQERRLREMTPEQRENFLRAMGR